MSEGTVGLIILTAIALGSALVWHWLVVTQTERSSEQQADQNSCLNSEGQLHR